MRKISVEKIPTWALCPIFNDDYTGLEEEDIDTVCKWLSQEWLKGATFQGISEYPYFSSSPAFGLPTEVIDVAIWQ